MSSSLSPISTEQYSKHDNQIFLTLSFTAMLSFTFGNYCLTYMTREAGLYTILYYSVGSTFISIFYYLIKMKRQHRHGESIWPNQNIINDGIFSFMNAFRLFLNCCIYCLCQVLIVMTIYFCAEAKINTGLITSIWALTPFFFAVCDYKYFGVKL